MGQEGRAGHVSDFLPTAATKELMARVARIADEVAIVFNHTGDRNADLLVHRYGLVHVLQRDFLRRCHDDGAVCLQLLREGERDVARTRRKIQEQEIELTPRDISQELHQRAVQHRTAPNDSRLCVFQHEADAHQFYAEALERLDLIAVTRRAAGDPEHRRNAGAVHVRVEQADFVSARLECESQIRRDGALPDAALAAHDEQNILRPGDGIFGANWPSAHGSRIRIHGGGVRRGGRGVKSTATIWTSPVRSGRGEFSVFLTFWSERCVPQGA